MNISKPKYIRFFSDIHLDFDISNSYFNKFERLWCPEKMPTDKQTALILAGDIWHEKMPFDYTGKSWIKKISMQFKYVIIVLGNHDFWGGSLEQEYMNYRKAIANQDLYNVFLLQNSSLFFDGLKFIGATLWTNYFNNKYCLNNALNVEMNDYNLIKNKNNLILPSDLLKEHEISCDYIFNNAKKEYLNQKLIVISHHCPSLKSKRNNDLTRNLTEDSLYFSQLDDIIEKSSIDLWIHGHYHYATNYLINKTRIMSNPRGYLNENTGYDPWLLMDTESFNLIATGHSNTN